MRHVNHRDLPVATGLKVFVGGVDFPAVERWKGRQIDIVGHGRSEAARNLRRMGYEFQAVDPDDFAGDRD